MWKGVLCVAAVAVEVVVWCTWRVVVVGVIVAARVAIDIGTTGDVDGGVVVRAVADDDVAGGGRRRC